MAQKDGDLDIDTYMNSLINFQKIFDDYSYHSNYISFKKVGIKTTLSLIEEGKDTLAYRLLSALDWDTVYSCLEKIAKLSTSFSDGMKRYQDIFKLGIGDKMDDNFLEKATYLGYLFSFHLEDNKKIFSTVKNEFNEIALQANCLSAIVDKLKLKHPKRAFDLIVSMFFLNEHEQKIRNHSTYNDETWKKIAKNYLNQDCDSSIRAQNILWIREIKDENIEKEMLNLCPPITLTKKTSGYRKNSREARIYELLMKKEFKKIIKLLKNTDYDIPSLDEKIFIDIQQTAIENIHNINSDIFEILNLLIEKCEIPTN